jgi:hypothetical protein
VTSPNGNGRKPAFDLAAAAAAEAAGEGPFAFTYKGKDYEVAPSSTWPMATLDRVGTEDFSGALADLLGGEVYAELVQAGLNAGELRVLFRAMGADPSGLTLPNSLPPARPASTRTSKRR